MNITRIDVNKKWSRAVIHNGVTYFCGQVAEQTDVGLAEQTQSALERLDALLRQVGCDRTKLLTVTIYLRRCRKSLQPLLPPALKLLTVS